jgi:hypothetical protein
MTDSGLPNILRENIVSYIKDDAWFEEAALERVAYELTELREHMDCFDDLRLSLVRDLAGLLDRHPRLLAKPRGSERSRALKKLVLRAEDLRQSLLESYRSFLRNSYKRYLPSESNFFVEEEAVKHMKEVLSERFESNIEPDINKTLETIRKFIARLNKEGNL